jgi:tetratricopeptide (TPR) repeat protein
MSAVNSSDAAAAPASPEAPVIAPAVRRRLQQCYDHAKKLMAQPKYDFDYAHTLLAECVATDPGNLVYAETFLENLAKKYDNNKKGARLQLFVNRGAIKKAQTAKNWLAVLKAGPELLKTNPWDIPTLRAMAEACEQLQLNEVELRYLKNALDANPQDVDVNRHCARSLARMGQYDQAIACWARVAELKKNDPEAQKMIGDLQIEKTKWKFGMLTPEDRKKQQGGAGQGAASPAAAKTSKPNDEYRIQSPAASSPAPEVDAEPPAAEAPKKREVQLTRWQKLERAIAEDPTVIENYLELSTVYGEEGKLAEAERALHKAMAVSGSDLRIRERLEEVHIARARQQLAIAERRAQTEETEQAKGLVKQLRENLNRVELEMYGHRSERYPQELKWKLEVGIRLKRAGNYSEAIKRLAEIPAESDLTPAALVETGESLQHLKQFSRALQTYQQAAALAETSGQSDVLKLALYRGGVLGVAMGDAAGRALLTRLVALDPVYRDANQRLFKLG